MSGELIWKKRKKRGQGTVNHDASLTRRQ
jgi:hypothetical protein